MKQTDQHEQSRSWLTGVLTDVQFWVPLTVLLGGLLLLKIIHQP